MSPTGSAPGREAAHWTPSGEELRASGRYFSAELETFYDILLVDDGLVLGQRRFAEHADVTPTAKKDAFAGGARVAQVEFIRNEAGTAVALEVGNGRSRGLRFERVGESGVAPGG